MSSEVETSLAGECRNPNDQCRNNDERRDKEQLNATLELRASFVIRHSCFVIFTLPSAVRYLVKARVKLGKDRALVQAIDEHVLGRGSIAGDEYLHNMEQARVTENGVAQWVETCFCDLPLSEEWPYLGRIFRPAQREGRPLRSQLPARERNRTVGLLQLRLHAEAGGKLRTQSMSFLNTLRLEKSDF